MLQLFLLTLSLLPWMPAFHCEVTVDGEYSVLEGGSLTIPCHYEPKYVGNEKYWCQGKTREFCTILARTDNTRCMNLAVEKVSIFDDPVQLVFTVTMNGLNEEDSGWYMCGVGIKTWWYRDDIGYTYIAVIHGLSAVHSQVSGEKGSSVTVECVYSERLRDSEKMWFRSGDLRSCRSTGSEGIYEDSSVVIRDDRIGAFTVTYKKLEKGDTAWYWCSAGQQKTPVRIMVKPPPTTTFHCKVTMDGEYSVLEGRSLTIPCHYEPEYVSHVKYWCQGRTRESCTILARTDDARSIGPAVEKVSIFDDPVQLVFTVTMNNLKEGDSGWYICGVEIGNLMNRDDIGYTYINVIHGLSAVHSQVSGEKGSSVTVECVYSEKLRDSEKMWCRSGDPRSCRSTGSEGIYEDSSVVIRDDRIGAFTVTYKKLEKRDTAWYWCSAGEQRTPVRIMVKPPPTTTFHCKVTVDGEYSVLEGGSLTIPCHYEPQYIGNVKYWCQGKTRDSCTILARTDDARSIGPAMEKVSIFDDPVQLVSTVTMNNLKEGDSGWYMCGVEIGNTWKADDIGYTYIRVIHGWSAVHSQMSGAEGSSVTVKCVYSERLRDSEKMWCRSGDPRSCRSTGSEGIYEDSSLVIRDDRIGAFTVTYKKLEKEDTAWYWCSAGQQRTPVRIMVKPPPTTNCLFLQWRKQNQWWRLSSWLSWIKNKQPSQ